MNTYIRLDGNNKPVNASNRLFKLAPRQGRWVKVNLSENYCCDTTTYTVTPTANTGTDFYIRFTCPSGNVSTFVIVGTFANEAEIVAALNEQLPQVGTFKLNGTDIDVRLINTVVNNCDGVTIVIDAV